MIDPPRLIPRFVRLGLLTLLVIVTVGCSSKPMGYTMVRPTRLEQAEVEVPEDELLDVGVVITQPRELKTKAMDKLGTTADIRQSESYYVPYQLKSTLQRSSHWGMVQVVPPEEDAFDLMVTTELVSSNGEILQLEVEAVDASGRTWLSRKYHAEAKNGQYADTEPTQLDAYQDMYNAVANDLAAFRRSLSPEQMREIRTVAKLRFASDFAPDAYADYLGTKGKRTVVERLPADDDPLMARVERIRERDHMFVDTLNDYYEGYSVEMWPAYQNWRRYNRIERVAKREADREAFMRILGGALMIAAAIALQAGDVPYSGAASGALIVGGGQVFVSGINVTEQANIHAEALKELAESFGADMRPTVLELEGKQYELTGTASEQYQEWRELLRRIYFEETGFDPDVERFGATPPPTVD